MLGARRLVSLTICGVLVLGAAACGDDDTDEPVTDLEAGGDDDTTITTVLDDEQAILEVYDAQWQVVLDAGDPPDPDAPGLAETMTGTALDAARAFLSENEAEGVALRGTYSTDAEVTNLTAESATVEDCGLDQTEIVVMSTGEVVEPFDDEPDGIVAEVVLEDGVWKVASLRDEPEVCS